jgi:hypothetical protein
MNSNGKHTFNEKIINTISRNFERIKATNFKEPRDKNNTSNFENENYENYKNYKNYENYKNYNNEENNDDFTNEGNLIYNIEDAFNDNVRTVENMTLESILGLPKKDISNPSNPSNPIEDFIDIEVQEDDHTLQNIIRNDNNKSDLDKLLLKIPMNKEKSKKDSNKKDKKDKEILIVDLLNHVSSNNKDTNTNVLAKQTNDKDNKDELLPISKYLLLDLQILASGYKINKQKEGKNNKKINKTKEELYNEIKEKF